MPHPGGIHTLSLFVLWKPRKTLKVMGSSVNLTHLLFNFKSLKVFVIFWKLFQLVILVENISEVWYSFIHHFIYAYDVNYK